MQPGVAIPSPLSRDSPSSSAGLGLLLALPAVAVGSRRSRVESSLVYEEGRWRIEELY